MEPLQCFEQSSDMIWLRKDLFDGLREQLGGCYSNPDERGGSWIFWDFFFQFHQLGEKWYLFGIFICISL